MDLNSLALFRLMQLACLTQRQSVLAQNIANVDTPGYKPNDLKPFDFDSVLPWT
jgi:flagellar basal-body rod protein FlgB